MIEFWVEDVFGNSVYCLMVIVVQDNNGVCLQVVSGMIVGEVIMEFGQYVEGVMVEVMSNDFMMVYMINDGFFELLGVFFGGSYMVCFEWNMDLFNGVFILDLMFISCYIFGVQFLNMFYKMIVVDVNCLGFIFMLDIIVLCKMIFGFES